MSNIQRISDRWCVIEFRRQVSHVRLDAIRTIILSSTDNFNDQVLLCFSGHFELSREAALELIEMLKSYETTRIEERITFQALAEL